MTAVTAPGGVPTGLGGVERWYVTSPYVTERFVDGELRTLPATIAHAKEMGTLATACGVWAYSWRKIRDLSFPPPPGSVPGVEICRDCTTKVIEEW